MRLSEIITEIGYEIDRIAIDDRIKFRLQQAINTAYAAMPKEERQRTVNILTVNEQQHVDAPKDFGDLVTMYNSDKVVLPLLTYDAFFAQNKLVDTGVPENYLYWNNQFLFSPVPDDAITFTLNYNIEHPNIYVHNLSIEHKSSMAEYVQVYIDEDGERQGEGKLLFVSPTTANVKVWLQTSDGHRHEVIVYHDNDAATKGVAWYFDEDAANADERNFFISPTGARTSIKTDNIRRHHHYLNFIHNPDPTTFPDTDNVKVYLDKDNVDRTLRLAFISPTTATGTDELVHTPEGELPGMLERYHSVIFELAVAKCHRFNHNYEYATQHSQAAAGLMSLITGKPTQVVAEEGRSE